MSLTIDATNKGADANSYITEAEADTFMEKTPHFSSTWDALDSTTKIQWIIYAASSIDLLEFSGRRYVITQSMKFPRNITDKITTSGIMPTRIKSAQCEMLIYLYNYSDSNTGELQRRVSEMMIDGSFSVKFSDIDYNAQNIVGGSSLKTIMNILSPWLAQNTAHLRRC